ncbi:MAG: hypothetical protein AABX86_00865, partial [Nanoarchaeota archaeon]
YKHRFSVDADIVVQSHDLEKFESILKKEKFKKVRDKNLDNVYSSRFMRYEKDLASVDLMIDAVASRNTNASFSYQLLLRNAFKRKIQGIEKEISALVPSKELIIVLKLHSGRLTDFRDIAALAKDTNTNIIKKFLFIGDLKVLQDNLNNLKKLVHDKNFINAFKGVFIEKKFDIDLQQIEKIGQITKD